jgi:peptide/nickel transport system permease protein
MAEPLPDGTIAVPPELAAAAAGVEPRRKRGWTGKLDIAIPAAVLLVIAAACFLWPLVGPVGKPVGGSILDSNLNIWAPHHWLGTDRNGNDIWSRLLYGGRISFEVAFAVSSIGLVAGGILGSIAGYLGGIVDGVIMRIVDVTIAFPAIVIALAIAEGLGPGESHEIWALLFFSIPAFARIARAETLRLREQTFMLAARLSGTKTWRILLRHIAPNILPALMTFALLGAGVVIILEGALSFFGLGIPQPGASWGNMIADGQGTLSASPRLVLVPSAVLLVTVVGFNLLGDALRAHWSSR